MPHGAEDKISVQPSTRSGVIRAGFEFLSRHYKLNVEFSGDAGFVDDVAIQKLE